MAFLLAPFLFPQANVSLASEEYTDAVRLYQAAATRLDASKQSQVGEGRKGYGIWMIQEPAFSLEAHDIGKTTHPKWGFTSPTLIVFPP